jgi:hypothetical protein
MLTIFCSPKPFVGETAWNQMNALRSWRAIHPEIDIFIFGAPRGAREAALQVGAVLVPEVPCSPSNAPSFNAMASRVGVQGRHDMQLYVNCDILLNDTVLTAIEAVRRRFANFLMVGERLDLKKGARLDVRDAGWAEGLPYLMESGALTAHGPTGADYFGFARNMWKGLPPVFMGRAMCDQALLHYALRRHIPVIDATLAIAAVHQSHDYDHLPGGREEVRRGGDQALMSKAHGLRFSLPTVNDADWRFGHDGHLGPNRRPRRLLRRLELALRYRFKVELAAMFLRLLQHVAGKKAVAPLALPAGEIVGAWKEYREQTKYPIIPGQTI